MIADRNPILIRLQIFMTQDDLFDNINYGAVKL